LLQECDSEISSALFTAIFRKFQWQYLKPLGTMDAFAVVGTRISLARQKLDKAAQELLAAQEEQGN